MNVGVVGGSGMLGTALLDVLAPRHTVFAASRKKGHFRKDVIWQTFDLLDRPRLVEWLREVRPAVVVHCAAMVNVDECETEPVRARLLHAGTTAAIAATLLEWNGRLIYVSTDSVFNGVKYGFYYEEDETDPRNIYALTKREGELAALANVRSLVIRVNIFGWGRPDQLSFAEWVLKGLVEGSRRTMFADVTFTPIHVSHLAEIVSAILDADHGGIFHVGGKTRLSKYEFATRMAAAFGLPKDNLIACSVDDAAFLAQRPKNTALSSQKLRETFDLDVPEVDDGLALFKQQYDNQWIKRVKGCAVNTGYRFWELA